MADTADLADTSRALMVVPRDSGRLSSGWFGMGWLITGEAALFAYLLFSYFYSMLSGAGPWPPDGPPTLLLALPNTAVLLLSSVAAWASERSAKRSDWSQATLRLVAAIALGALFVAIQLVEWHNKPFSITSHLYGSFYFTITGFHMAHVAVGIAVLSALAWWSYSADRRRQAAEPISIGAIYWHFVDAVWLAVFATFYLVPYLR
jgi:cytochrome c oxidase subunit III